MSREYADAKCPKCLGRGFLYPKSMLTLPGERGGRYCDCALDALRRKNMERIWPSLSTAPTIPGLRDTAPLTKFLKKSLWITGRSELFKAHLQSLAYNRSSMWDCRVYTDAQLLDSWFGTAKAQGVKIFDLEVDKSTLEAIDLRDLIEPPDLVVLMLGVKQLPNKEAPNSLLEALSIRKHVGKPTWIVDQPDQRIDMDWHRYYSEQLEGWLNHWIHLELTGASFKVISGPYEQPLETVSDHEVLDILEDESEPPQAPPPKAKKRAPTANRSAPAQETGNAFLDQMLKTESSFNKKKPKHSSKKKGSR